MRVCLVQFDPAWENPEENRRRIRALVDRLSGIAAVSPQPADMIILPEMCLTGFTMNPHAHGAAESSTDDSSGDTDGVIVAATGATVSADGAAADHTTDATTYGATVSADGSADGAVADHATDSATYGATDSATYGATDIALDARGFFSQCARSLNCAVVAGYGELDPDGMASNRAGAWSSSGKLLADYVKNYPFSYSGEDRVYRAGKDASMLSIGGLRFGLYICYDLRFPEHFRRLAGQVDCYLVVANWPLSRMAHWRSLLVARAVENQAWVIGVNRRGKDGNGIRYPGVSVVVDPMGEICAEGGEEDELVWADISKSFVDETRARFPFLNDRK